LPQYASTGTFYGKVKGDGKLYREKLKTNVFSAAKPKLADFLKAKMRKRRAHRKSRIDDLVHSG
jgi:hypothetical protein